MYKSKEQLRQEALALIVEDLRAAEMRQGCTNYTHYADILLRQLECLIFAYAPLPEFVQEALNTGDGAYRP